MKEDGSRWCYLLNSLLPYLSVAMIHFVHLRDGGVADDLGLRALLERVYALGVIWTMLKCSRLQDVNKMVFSVVKDETKVIRRWNLVDTMPSIGAMLDSYSSISISRYNFETVKLLKERFFGWKEEIRRHRCGEESATA